MALPTILVNSASGSDSLASGAGPGTAVTGTAAATDGTNGKTVTITDTVDLSGVATDGSAAIYLNDSTAGHRNFDNITAVSGSSGSWTVTVANGFSLSLSGKSWAIGGKRASIGSSTSVRLIENNASNGDAMPGWIIEMQSGHSETIAATINPRRAGDTTNGRIVLRGTTGAATRPLLTFSNNGDAFTPRAGKWTFQGFELQNSNVSKTSAIAFDTALGSDCIYRNIKCDNAANNFKKFYNVATAASNVTIEDCSIGNCANVGIDGTTGLTNFRLRNCNIFGCTSHGATLGTGPVGGTIEGNVFAYNGGDGLLLSYVGGTPSAVSVESNVFHGNTSSGLEFAATSTNTGGIQGVVVENNEFTFNGGDGVNFSGSGIVDAVLDGSGLILRNNAFFGNTIGKYNPSTITVSKNEVTTDPSGGLASATKDYAGTTSGTNFMSSVHKALGYPAVGPGAVGTVSASTSYRDIGLQHQDAGSSGPVAVEVQCPVLIAPLRASGY